MRGGRSITKPFREGFVECPSCKRGLYFRETFGSQKHFSPIRCDDCGVIIVCPVCKSTECIAFGELVSAIPQDEAKVLFEN